MQRKVDTVRKESRDSQKREQRQSEKRVEIDRQKENNDQRYYQVDIMKCASERRDRQIGRYKQQRQTDRQLKKQR